MLTIDIGLDKKDAEEIRQWARSDFERYKTEKDLVRSKLNLQRISHSLVDSFSVGENQVSNNVWKASNAQRAAISHACPS